MTAFLTARPVLLLAACAVLAAAGFATGHHLRTAESARPTHDHQTERSTR